MELILANKDLICKSVNPYEVASILRYANVLNQYDLACIDEEKSSYYACLKIIRILESDVNFAGSVKFLDAIKENNPFLTIYLPELAQGLRISKTIGTDKIVKVLTCGKEIVVDIRKYRIDSNAISHPTEFGVTLNLRRYSSLESKCEELIEALRCSLQIESHIGGRMYAVNLEGQSLLKLATFKGPPDSHMLTAEGIDLTLTELENFFDIKSDISNVTPELSDVIPCYMEKSHQNQEGYFNCCECNPFTDLYDFY